MIRWFDRDNEAQVGLLRDRYRLDGDKITFSPEFHDMDEGEEMVIKVDYRGRVTGGGASLELTVGSREGSSNSAQINRFAQVP